MSSETSIIDLAILRLETLSFRAQKYMDEKMMDHAIREILDPMKSIALQRGHAQSFIDSMSIVKLDFMKLGFAIDLTEKTATGIPKNKLLEYGWMEFDIVSRYPEGPMLHWTGGKYGAGDHFAYSTHHPGFPGYHMLMTLENWGFIQVFIFKLVLDTAQYLEATSFK